MVPISLLEQAKGGDAAAIAMLMNQALQAKGIVVRGDRQGDCLQLWLTGQTLPPQTATVNYVRRGLDRLQLSPTTVLHFYGEQADRQEPGWGVEIALGAASGEVRPLVLENAAPDAEAAAQAQPSEEPAPASPSASPELTPGTIPYAYALLGLAPNDPLKSVESAYFKLKAQALREGDRAHVEQLKQAFYQLKDYIEHPPATEAASSLVEAPVLASQDESLTALERIAALLKERGVSAQVSLQGSQLSIAWLAVRVINPEEAASQVQSLLTQDMLASMGLYDVSSLAFFGLNRSQDVVWQQTSPLVKR
ncbi:hypothetical protein [Nodosilinea sp. E11]|uniref:hypothetical protein n=1 Tax=Nodosilinea sp. E11 TaxID=3037479 RepID=UPI0029350312|nr:hypothetical protein [Nodosilinea sp. E11]WOD41408.1 hypothetical protein RRF56_11445 [Nodosilinea sp. E11]